MSARCSPRLAHLVRLPKATNRAAERLGWGIPFIRAAPGRFDFAEQPAALPKALRGRTLDCFRNLPPALILGETGDLLTISAVGESDAQVLRTYWNPQNRHSIDSSHAGRPSPGPCSTRIPVPNGWHSRR